MQAHKTKAERWVVAESAHIARIVRAIDDLRTCTTQNAGGQLRVFELTETVRQSLRSARRFGERKAR